MARYASREVAGFTESGSGTLAANSSTLPYGESSTLLSCECPHRDPDPRSRAIRAALVALIRPFVSNIMRATLKTIGPKPKQRPHREVDDAGTDRFGSKRGGTAGLAA